MTKTDNRKVDTEIAKLIAGTAKLNKETLTSLVVAVGAVMKFIL